MIVIELSEIDATAFKLFRQYQDKIVLLVSLGVFETRNGSVELHFNNEGLASIDKHERLYRQATVVMLKSNYGTETHNKETGSPTGKQEPSRQEALREDKAII